MGEEGEGPERDKDTKEPRNLALHRTDGEGLARLRGEGKKPKGSEEKERNLKALRRAKNAMIDMRLGYGSQAMSYLLVDWKNRHPEAYEAFREELGR